MRCLVLDTETSSLSPTTGQIIELGAVIIQLDPVTASLKIEAEFSSLIKPRYEIDEKITRLTGITLKQLLPAPSHLEIQEKWAHWLEQNSAENLPVIGHSIDFDLGFLREEGWMIPTGKGVDTLDACKLLLPHISAVNLEHLMNTFQLPKKFSSVNLDGSKLQPHRALYDTKATAWLVRELVEIAQKTGLSTATIQYFQHIFLPNVSLFPAEVLQMFTTDVPIEKTQIETESEEIHIDVLGNLRGQNLVKTVATGLTQNADKNRERLLNSLENGLAIHLKNKDVVAAGVLAKMLVFISKIGGVKFPKLHLHGSMEYAFLTTILHRFQPDKIDKSTLESTPQTHVLINPEQFISRIGFIAERSLDIGELITWLELSEAIKIVDEEGVKQLHKTTAQFDFFLFGMQSWWNYGQFFYTPDRLTQQQFSIRDKFDNLLLELKRMRHILQKTEPKIEWSLLQKDLLAELQNRTQKLVELELSASKNYTFRQRGNGFVISEQKRDFSVQNELNALIEKHDISAVESYLSRQNLDTLWQLIGAKIPPAITDIRTHDEPSMIREVARDFDEIVAEMERTIQREKKHIVLFVGQQPTLKMLQSEVKNEVENMPTLVIGEDGGITKLMSKLDASKPALVVAKSGDAGTLIRKLSTENTAEIWLVNEPYLRLHHHWKKAAEHTTNPEHFLANLKGLRTAALCAKIQDKTGLKVHFLRGFEG